MHSPFESGLRYVIDGAMATELERRGAVLDDALWSAKLLVESPALIEAVHYDYFVAGADIALTASYQASLAGFATRGLDAARARALIASSVALAERARSRFLAAHARAPGRPAPLIGASIGAFGAHRHDGSEYRGDYGVGARTLRDFHRRQLEVLARTAADFVAFETVPSRLEAEAILCLLEEFPELPAWISFACRDGARTGHGEPFADCVALVQAAPGIVAAGLNCTAPRHVEPLLRAASARATKPLFAYPNSGEARHAGERTWSGGVGHDALAAYAPRWLAAGATLLGGCCRTTPADIGALAAVIAARRRI